MSTPLPPELAALEERLSATRAPLPPGLRARVLSAPARKRPPPLSLGWFAAAAAAAAAVLLNLSQSAALPRGEPAGALDRCAVSRALHEAPEQCTNDAEKP